MSKEMESPHELRILFVEDLPSDVELAERELRKQGVSFTSLRVDTRETFLEALEKYLPDVIISDYSLPKFNGKQALELTRKRNPAIPFILVTGSINEETAVACMKAGATDYVIKEQMARLPFAVMEALEQEKNRLAKEEAERRLRYQAQLLENVSDAIISTDLTFTIGSWNRAAEATHGWQAHEVIGKPINEIIPTEIPGTPLEATIEQLMTVGHWQGEVIQERRDGTKLDVLSSVSLVRDQAGNPTGVVAVNRDITARKQAEEALKNSEKRFRSLIENGLDNISLVDAEGTLLWESPAIVRTLGYPQGEFISRSTFELIHPDDLSWTQTMLTDLLREPGSRRNGSFRLRHIDGTWRWVEAVVTNLLDEPSVKAIVINYRDITERRQAEAQLQLQSAALNAAANAIIITDSFNTIEWVNPAFLELTGYTSEEVIGKNIQGVVRSGVHDNAFYQNLSDTTHAGNVWRGDIINRRKDGSLLTLDLTITPLKGAGGVISHFIIIQQDITLRKQAEESVHRQLSRLAALRTIDATITASLDLRLALNIVLREVIAQLNVDAVNILLLNAHLRELKYAAGSGFRSDALHHTSLRVGEGFAGQAVLERRIVNIPDLRDKKTGFLRSPHFAAEGFVAYYAIPLIAKGEVKGVLEVYHRSPLTPDAEWLSFLETLAGQAAIAIDNAQLFDGLQSANMELALAYHATIEGWSRALDLRDKETEGHTLRVTEMTSRLAQAMGLSEEELVHARRGALLHDIGKMGIPDAILLKPGPLTDEEWVIMRKHPTLAYELLSPIQYLRPALAIPYSHHEKWDGSGYPRGLKGDEIPFSARIFAVVDVWDALRSDRPYRPAWPADQVRPYIQEQIGKHFDPQIAEVFLTMIGDGDWSLE